MCGMEELKKCDPEKPPLKTAYEYPLVELSENFLG